MVEKNYVGLDLEIVGRRAAEDEEELELGLTLGKKKAATRGTKAATWAPPLGRILTAKNISSPTSRASPASSSASSSSATNLHGGGRTKRAAADSISDDPFSRPPHPPNSQVVVGWPPIGTFRMNSTLDCSTEIASLDGKTVAADCQKSDSDNDKEAKRAQFVKVYMEGDPIGRKVDLRVQHSYKDLALKLELMFRKPMMDRAICTNMTKGLKLLDESSEFVVTYEDRDGDWMLLGDVPWGMFMDTVKRLRIIRT